MLMGVCVNTNLKHEPVGISFSLKCNMNALARARAISIRYNSIIQNRVCVIKHVETRSAYFRLR